MTRLRSLGAGVVVCLFLGTGAPAQTLGRSDASFSQPSLAPGVDYVVPSEQEIKLGIDYLHEEPMREYEEIKNKPVETPAGGRGGEHTAVR